jgi:hypothetical protein
LPKSFREDYRLTLSLEHIVKNGCFHWKASCYNETMKNASILIKLGTNVDWTIAFVTTCSVLNFLLPWQWGDISKLPKITILPQFFPSKIISKCCNFSRDWDRVKGFSALVTRYLMIDLGSFLASHKSKIFLAMRRTTAPLQTPQTEGGQKCAVSRIYEVNR